MGSNGSNPLRRKHRATKDSGRNSSSSNPAMGGCTVVILEDVIPIVYLGGKPKGEIR